MASSSNDSFEDSVTQWIVALKQGDEGAAARLWERYFPKLIQVADRRLGRAERRVADEEDIAASVFASLCIGAREGRFQKLGDRDDLWKLLVAISGMKSVDQIRRQTAQKRGGGVVRGDSVMARAEFKGGFDRIISSDPTPEFILAMEEQKNVLFGKLRNDGLRRIARLRLEGYSNAEIAEKIGISVRSVERKLNLIRAAWSDEVDDEDLPEIG